MLFMHLIQFKANVGFKWFKFLCLYTAHLCYRMGYASQDIVVLLSARQQPTGSTQPGQHLQLVVLHHPHKCYCTTPNRPT